MDLVELVDDEHTVSFSAGDTVMSTGEPPDRMYVIVRGEVEVCIDGDQVRTLGPGELFGEMALIDDEPRSADVVAGTDCLLAPIDERRFLFLVHETPTFAMHVMKVMAQRLRSEQVS